MPEQTTNLNLPIPLGNENVNRQFFLDLINAIDSVAVSQTELEEALGGIVINDASTTQKGIVQLDDTNTSTSKKLAPTADALRRTAESMAEALALKQNSERQVDNYKKAAALPTEYPDGPTFFKITGGSANGWPVEFGNVTVKRTGNSATMMVEEVLTTGDTKDESGRVFFRNKRDANDTWQPFSRALTEADQALILTWANNVTDTRTTNAMPKTYAQGVTREFKSGSVVGLLGEGFALLETNKPWTDASGGRVNQIAFGGTTGNHYRRASNEDGSGWLGWVEIVHTGFPWQKHRLTADNGTVQNLPSATNLNDIKTSGFFDGSGLLNSPPVVKDGWIYIHVMNHSHNGVGWVKQTAYNFYSDSFWTRTCQDGAWQAWSEDLFTSVANGKASLKTAISGKGGTVSQAGSVATFAELVSGIQALPAISMQSYSGITGTLLEGYSNSFTGGNIYPERSVSLFSIPHCRKARILSRRAGVWSSRSSNNTYYPDGAPQAARFETGLRLSLGANSQNSYAAGPPITLSLQLQDGQGNRVMVLAETCVSYGYYNYIFYLEELLVDFENRRYSMYYANYTQTTSGASSGGSYPRSSTFPANFNVNNGPLTLIATLQVGSAENGYVTYWGGSSVFVDQADLYIER